MTEIDIGFLCGRLYEAFREKVSNCLHREQLISINCSRTISIILNKEKQDKITLYLKEYLPYINISFIIENNSTVVKISANRQDIIDFKIGGNL